MGVQLQEVVDYVRRQTRGIVSLDLARLNLKVGKPLSRAADKLPDDPAVVAAAWKAAREIVAESGSGAGA